MHHVSHTPSDANPRRDALVRWLQAELGLPALDLEPASEDASFRRYYRVRYAGRSVIAMDAPPDKENVRVYMDVARLFRHLGLNVPEVLASDLERGFLLITDLGTALYLHALNDATVERLYGDALGALMVLQACGPADAALPCYDQKLLRNELELFREWYLKKHLGFALDEPRNQRLDAAFERLVGSALEQPQVCVHRDYHSRNLMVTARNNPGILDFQGAVVGPVTYDLVSLLRDCYVAWPRARVEEWALGYHDLAVQSGVLREENEERFLRWFDLMGVQRHLKAAGIFARLHHRDGKPAYLRDIPRTLGYAREVSARYPELSDLHELLCELPAADAP